MKPIIDAGWHHFVKVAELGSISRAALAADVPQSVVSRHISLIEGDVGSPLFRRTGRGVVLTELGQQLYPRIKQLIAETQSLADEMRASRGVPVGDVRLGLLPSTVPALAGALYQRVLKEYPRVRLHLTEGSSSQLQELLDQGRLDLSLLLRDGGQAAPDEPVLVEGALCLVVASSDPLARRHEIRFEEVGGLPLVLPGEPHPLRERLALLARKHGLSLRIAAEANSIRLQHEIAASAAGYAITAESIAAYDRNRLVAVKIVEPVLARAIVLAVARHRPHTLATREIRALLLSIAPAILAQGDGTTRGFA
ncbi:LysR family transcriptional regulator [Ramlibacter henchirensis]|uniref:LysR family transcriptional regulator n=1 Tax=Ramlibacter henchirensis TaxID=204072 RepID=UPI001F0F0A7D|nr:LysR family transcriptional regulator [Ramlibacter henchirensis]